MGVAFKIFHLKFKKSIVVKIDGKTCIGLGHIQHVSLDGQYNKKFWYYENNTWQEFPHEFPETLHNPVVAIFEFYWKILKALPFFCIAIVIKKLRHNAT